MILYETAAEAAEPAAGDRRRACAAHRGENRQSLTPNAHAGHRMLREPMFPEIFLEVCAMACFCNGFSGLTFPDFVQQRCCNPCCRQSSGSVGGTSTTNPTCTCTCTCTQGSGSVAAAEAAAVWAGPRPAAAAAAGAAAARAAMWAGRPTRTRIPAAAAAGARAERQTGAGAKAPAPGVYLKTPNAPGQRAFSRCAASFFLEIRQYSCEKMSCSARKFLAAGHIAGFQIHPGRYFTNLSIA